MKIIRDNKNSNVFAGGLDVFWTIASRRQSQNLQRQRILRLPLFAPFVCHNKNTVNQTSHANYSKENSEWQWHVFEEKAGNADAYDVFPKIAVNFGNKLLGFFFEDDVHVMYSFRLYPSAKDSRGNYSGWDGSFGFNFNEGN